MCLCKEGFIGFANSGNELHTKHYTAKATEAMGDKYVDYVPKNWDGHFAHGVNYLQAKKLNLLALDA